MSRLMNMGSLGIRGLVAAAVGFSGLIGFQAEAQEQRTFILHQVPVTLVDTTPDADVYLSSMLLNRALNVWNVQVVVSNRSARVLSGPVVLLVEGFTATSGPQEADGTLDEGQAFYDLTAWTSGGSLTPGATTAPRTLTLGRSGSRAPALFTRVYAGRSTQATALAVTRSLDEAGRPLRSVAMAITGPAGSEVQQTDEDSGVASFGQGPGAHVVRFSREGYLPVWRQGMLAAGGTAVLPNPRLTPRSPNPVAVTPLGGATLTDATGGIEIRVAAGAVEQVTTLTLTALSSQDLPAFLPWGWSPLRAFWIESDRPLSNPLTARLRPSGPMGQQETAAWVRWREDGLHWRVEETLLGQGTNAVEVLLPEAGAYALVVPDVGEWAPPPAQAGQALSGIAPRSIDLTGLSAVGSVSPSSSPASRVPGLVTATAQVELRHASQRLPSGYLLRGEVTESYLLADGSLRLTPQYEHFIAAYQRPGDQDPFTLHASFPMRPLLLFGPEELDAATVRVDVLPDTPFDGQVLDAGGGQVVREGVRLLAGSGRLTGPSALRLRRLDATWFLDLVAEGQAVVAAFELTVDRSSLTGPLAPQLSGAPADGWFLLARVLSEVGFYGLQPVERLRSDADGNLSSLEPLTGEQLPGLRGSGQFVLVQVGEAQGLVTGVARNGAGEVQADMPVRLAGLPWLTLTDDQGRFQLVAPAGEVELGVTDPATGDTGFANVTVADPQAAVVQDLAAASAGPRVARITPGHEAVRVPRVGSVVIEFNEAVNPATVIGNAIQLLQPDGSVVPAALTLNLRNTTATLSPATELEANTDYRVRLAATIADPGGLPLEGQSEFTFTTVPLSTRVATAQLIIYEPGATNVPPAILDDIPAFEPGDDPFAIVVHGQPGVADPEVPVILVNESTGETQTVLSKVDGSFSSFISGTEEDFVSATFVNLNGTRVYVPVSRQEFDNGFVGLYPQGGILEAESDGGPVQVLIQPQAVPSRTKFRIRSLSRGQLLQLTQGVTPDVATLGPGAMRIEFEGPTPTEPMQISFPINLEALGYPADEAPEDAALVLARLRDNDGITTFEVMDQMVFTPTVEPIASNPSLRLQGIRPQDAGSPSVGTVLTVVGFFPSITVGLVTPLLSEHIIMPLLLGSRPVAIKGITQYLPQNDTAPPSNFLDAAVTALSDSFNSQLIVNPVQGAFVILREVGNPVFAAPGRLQPGNLHATSGADGKYLMVAPRATADYLVMATHPSYADQPAEAVRAVTDITLAGAVFKRLVFREKNSLNVPLRINISHAPQFPAPGQDCEVQISAFRIGGEAPEILVPFIGVTNLTTGVEVNESDLVLTDETSFNNGLTRLWRGTLRAGKPLQAQLRIKVDGQQTIYPISFSGVVPPVFDTPLPKPDTNDVHGPIVISTLPPEGGYLDVSGEITLLFNKPIDRSVTEASTGIILDGPGMSISPVIRLDAGQKSLVIQYAGLEPDREYTVTVTGQAVRDLAGQPLDQRPSTPEADSFRLRFRSAPIRHHTVPGVANGRGAAINGNSLFVIDGRAGEGRLLAYNISDPSLPSLSQEVRLRGQPRDLLVIPQYAHRRQLNGPALTNDFVVVVGGDLDAQIDDDLGNVTVRGQYLNVYAVEETGSLTPVATPIVSFRVGSAVTKVRWSAPHLVYQEFGADIQQLGLVHLQELLVGFGSPPVTGEFRAGRPGVDLNGDGDYVDEGEVVPIPEFPPVEFYGKKFGYVLSGTTQKILDFDPIAGGQLIGITLTRGLARDLEGKLGGPLRPSYRTLGFNLATEDPTDSTYKFNDPAYPRWVKVFPSLPILTNGVPVQPMVALVSLQPDEDGEQKLAVIDISLPQTPQLINKIPIPEELLGGSMQSMRLREDGLLELAGSRHLLLLNSLDFGVTNFPAGQVHPAVVGFIPSAGASSRSLGHADSGYRAVADGGRGDLIQIAPTLRFVQFPASPTVVNPAAIRGLGGEALMELVRAMRTTSVIPPARARGNEKLEIPSDLDPPRPQAHFHVSVEAPGSSGDTIELGLESVNHAGVPLSNFGRDFAPVRAVSSVAQDAIGQHPRPDCGAPIRSLTAWRMSDDPFSPYYNRYLSRPFAVLANETLSLEEQQRLQGVLDREILHGGAGLRAFIDPSLAENRVIGLFAAKVDERRKQLLPVASAQAITLFHPYVMGDNPPPPGGYVALPATYGMVAAHSGELRTETIDMALASPRMPIVIQRVIGNQDTYEGPFGVGWDFNYNQRITELDPLSFPLGLQMPLIVRGTKADSDIAGSQDVLFNTGVGKVIRFRWVSTNMPAEYAVDPLVDSLNYAELVSDYYLPARGQGTFDLLVKFRDGRFERLTPDGVRSRYAASGRLERVIDRFPANRHELEYDRNGWLVRIDDRSVQSPRFVELGYYRTAGDIEFREGLDERTSNARWVGKVIRLRNYAGDPDADVLFTYDEDGFLIRRDGVQLSGANGGFSGRAQTHYLYQNCRFAGVKVTRNGTPLFAADTEENSSGKPVATAGSGIGGGVGIRIPLENSAITLENQTGSADLADSSVSDFEFDAYGHPRSIRSSGARGAAAETATRHNVEGLLEFVRHPEGNSETLVYDSTNPIFRSRANLLRHTVDPGSREGEGYTLEFAYDSRYNLKAGAQRNANGFSITRELREDGRELRRINHGAAGSDSFSFDDNGQLKENTDTRGVRTIMEYDTVTGFLKTQTSGETVYRSEYDGSYAGRLGKPFRIAPAEGHPIELSYDRKLQITEKRRGELRELTGYDEQGRAVFMQRFLGDGRAPITRKDFDAKGFLLRITTEGVEVNGVVRDIVYEFTPDALSRIKTVTLPQGTVQEHELDNQGNLIKRTIGDYVEEYEVDLHGNVTEVRRGGEVVEETAYDGLDRPKLVTRHFGDKASALELDYYPGGEVRSHRLLDEEYSVIESVSFREIDALGRVITAEQHGTTIQPRYDYVYEPLAVTETGPRAVKRSTWNEAGYTLTISDATTTVNYTPDANGRTRIMESREDGFTYTDTFTYDELDNPETHSDLLGLVLSYDTRADGKPVSTTNPRGNSTVMEHSALGELIRKRRADGLEFRYEYDSLRHATYIGDRTAGVVSAYDASTRLESMTRRDGAQSTYTDFDGRRQPRTIQIPGGSVLMDYDLQQRVIAREVNFNNTFYAEKRRYDALNRVRELRYGQTTDTPNASYFDYDQGGPLLSARFDEDGSSFTVSYEYRNDRTRRAIVYPSGVRVEEDRDASGRLLSVSNQNGMIVNAVSWQGNANPRVVMLGPARIVNQYDARGRLTAARATRAADGRVLAHMRYRLDPASNLEARQYLHRAGRADQFAYDAGERVTGAEIGGLPDGDQSLRGPQYRRVYTYDSNGLDYLTGVSTVPLGLSPPAFAASWSNHDQLLLPGTVAGFDRGTADPAGNVQAALVPVRKLSAPATEPMELTLAHDGNGNLVRVRRGDGLEINNFFQPEGLRYRREITMGGQVLDHRHFVYDDGARLIEEYDLTTGAPEVLARYYYSSGDVPVAADLYDPAVGGLQRYYLLRDSMESIIAAVDASGEVVERIWYDTHGQAHIEGRDTRPPSIRSVGSDESGALLIALTEPVFAPLTDPGEGEGIVDASVLDPAASVLVSANSGAVPGTIELLAELEGHPAYSVIRFTPDEALPATPPDVLAWWPGDADVIDVVAGNRGVLRGGAAVGPGLNQQAFLFNGAGAHVEITNSSALNLGGGDFTLSAWVRFGSVSGEQVLLEKWNGSDGSGWSLLKTADQRLRLTLAQGGIVESAALDIPVNRWVQIGARRGGDAFALFTNGVSVATGSHPASISSSATLKFGSRSGTTAFLTGALDEVTIRGRALTDQEMISVAGGVTLPGPVTVSLSAASLADEWGNLNVAETIAFAPVDATPSTYYQSFAEMDTAAPATARSAVGLPFLFHGHYTDYDAGLLYLRSRFYDPFSGMFLEPDPLGYEDSVNLYAGMGNNPVGYRDPSGLNFVKWLVGEVTRVGGRGGAATVRTMKPSGLSNHADGMTDAFMMQRVFASTTENATTPLMAERIGKFAGATHQLEDAKKPVVLGLEMSKDKLKLTTGPRGEIIEEALDPSSVRYTAKLVGGRHFMNSKNFKFDVDQAIAEGRKFIVDVSNMGGRTLAEKIENAIAREVSFIKDYKRVVGPGDVPGPGQHYKFMTDWEMYRLWESNLLPDVTFVQRFGDDVYELANPFVRQLPSAAVPQGVTKAKTGGLTLGPAIRQATDIFRRHIARPLRLHLGFERASDNLFE